jgi:hypothetical protein
VDGASIGIGLGIASGGNAGAGVAVWQIGYVLGGPVVHFSHGNIGKGFADLGIRLVAPVALGITGLIVGTIVGASAGGSASANSSGTDFQAGGTVEGLAYGVTIGFFGGELAAIIIDAAGLAREKVDDDAPPPPAAAFTWRPDLGLVHDRPAAAGAIAPSGLQGITGGTVGIAGTF